MGNHPLAVLAAGAPCPPARHKHAYTLPAWMAPCWKCKRRQAELTHGGPIPATVCCERCRDQLKVATAYERGKEDAPDRAAS